MMLMTKFGKFKLRFIATINLSVLLSVLSLAAIFTNYWVKYTDKNTLETDYAGLWFSCPTNGRPCSWKNGIVEGFHTMWSICVRFLLSFGTCLNVIAAIIFFTVLFYKMYKPTTSSKAACVENGGTTPTKTATTTHKTSIVIAMMEWANLILCASFIVMIIGFCIFVSSQCTLSLWLHCICMCLIICSSNMLTRTFATMYFQNTRHGICKTLIGETTISQSKLAEYNVNNGCAGTNDEEKVCLKAFENGSATTIPAATETTIEMQKINESNGSKEALIQPTTATVNIVELKTAVSNTNLNSQPETVVSMSTSNKAINKC